MVCKPSLVVPPQYLGLGVHSRGKRDQPQRGDQGEDEGEESGGCRDRVQQTQGYTVPKTAAQLETVDSEESNNISGAEMCTDTWEAPNSTVQENTRVTLAQFTTPGGKGRADWVSTVAA